MNIIEAMSARHSVRSYLSKPIPQEIIKELNDEIEQCNAEGNLNIQLVTNEPKAFDSTMAHYGKFSGVNNYIVLAGKKSEKLDEKIGFYGERIALKAQMLGLNTCWVAMSFSKGTAKKNIALSSGEKMVTVLAVGYGAVNGVPHKSKKMTDLCKTDKEMPEWFKNGMEAAMLAPTAMNQQKFLFTLENDKVYAKSLGGFYSQVDLGIVKYHFEEASGKNTQ